MKEFLSSYHWLESCKDLDEVKEKYPNPEDDWAIHLEDPKDPSALPGDCWVAWIEDGEWVQTRVSYDAKEAKIARLEQTLKFYANSDNYAFNIKVGYGDEEMTDIELDNGARARKALYEGDE